MRAVDSTQEKVERLITSVINRKNKVPEMADLEKLQSWSSDMLEKLDAFISFISVLARLFGAF